MLSRIRRLGRQAAYAAGAVLARNFNQPQRITLKGRHDPVTETDLESQRLIVNHIRQAFPEHRILAEEKGVPLTGTADSDGRWIIDPLDGTVNYAHGFPMFAVSIAFEWQGEVIYGIIYDPLREECFEAVRGEGAWLNEHPLRVSETGDLEQALLATGFPYNVAERLEDILTRFRQVLAVAEGVRRPGAATLDLCYLAAGRLDGFWEEGLKPWDTAAGILIVTEAGGKVTNFQGRPYSLTDDSIAASNGRLHDQLLQVLQLPAA